MNIRLRSTQAALTATLVIPSLIFTMTPSYAANLPDEVDLVEDAIQSLESIPEAGPIAAATSFTVEADGSLVSENEDVRLTVDSGDSPTVELDSTQYEPLRVDAGLSGQADIADEGTVVFTSEEAYSVSPLPHEGGSVQIITVLDNVAAPVRYDYDLSSTSDVMLEIRDSGMVVIRDDAGEWLGGVASPWAFDADGVSVPTHFEVSGSTLTQVVDHQAGDFAYPISADPWLGQNLWTWHSIDSYNGAPRVNLRLSAWGVVHQPQPWVLINAGWPEALDRSAAMRTTLTSKATMRQQFDCHAFGSAFAGDWNLEKSRVNRTVDWTYGVAIHRCNRNTATQY